MFGRALMAAAAVVAIALSTGAFLGSFDEAEAGKPELLIGDISLTETIEGNCVVTVNWSGLKGRRMLEIGTKLVDESGRNIDGGIESTMARYDAGQVVVDYGPMSGVAAVQVTFSDHKAVPMHNDPVEVAGTCN